MSAQQRIKLAEISWEGDSRDVLSQWPKPIKLDFGLSLREMQEGRQATLDVRPMKSIDAGVFELKDSDDAKWYRMIYLARIDDVIYVLHCFEKDSKKTDKRDLNIATRRLAEVRKRLMEERKHVKLKERK